LGRRQLGRGRRQGRPRRGLGQRYARLLDVAGLTGLAGLARLPALAGIRSPCSPRAPTSTTASPTTAAAAAAPLPSLGALTRLAVLAPASARIASAATTTRPTAPAPSPALPALVSARRESARSGVLTAGLDIGVLGREQLDTRLEIGVYFYHADLGDVRWTDARTPRPAAEARAA